MNSNQGLNTQVDLSDILGVLNLPNTIFNVNTDIAKRVVDSIKKVYGRKNDDYDRMYNEDLESSNLDFNQKDIVRFCLILDYLANKGVRKTWLDSTAIECYQELFDEFDNLGFFDDNPFPTYLVKAANIINIIDADGYAVIHNAYADDLLSYKDLVGLGIFKFTNIIFNQSFFFNIRSYNDRTYLLTVQDKLRPENINSIYKAINKTLVENLKELKDTSNLTKFEIILKIFLYARNLIDSDLSIKLNLINIDNDRVRTANEVKKFLNQYRNTPQQDTEQTLKKVTKLPANLSENQVEGIIWFFDNRLGDENIHKQLVNINKKFNENMTIQDIGIWKKVCETEYNLDLSEGTMKEIVNSYIQNKTQSQQRGE